jgi:hypothetical protein
MCRMLQWNTERRVERTDGRKRKGIEEEESKIKLLLLRSSVVYIFLLLHNCRVHKLILLGNCSVHILLLLGSCIVLILLRISFKHIPAITTENLFMLFFSLFTTCFGPFGPSSGETQLYFLYISRKLSILQRIRCFTICLLLSIYTKANAQF